MIRITRILTFLSLMLSASSQASLEIVITEGIDSARPIAVVPFKWNGPGQMPEALSEVISGDLLRSGKFSPIDTASMPGQPHTDSELDYRAWAATGVEAILVGSVTPEGPDRYRVNFTLVDAIRGQITGGKAQALNNGQLTNSNDHILDSRQTVITGEGFRQYAHRISDVVYEKLTGEKGAFMTRIAYVVVRDRKTNAFPYQLVVADYDGVNETMLLRSKEPLMSPSWSPDGTKLAYVTFENKRSQIYIQDLYTMSRTQMTDFSGINSAPVFSPNGKQLAMVLSKDGNPEIYVMDIASKRLERITRNRAIDTVRS